MERLPKLVVREVVNFRLCAIVQADGRWQEVEPGSFSVSQDGALRLERSGMRKLRAVFIMVVGIGIIVVIIFIWTL